MKIFYSMKFFLMSLLLFFFLMPAVNAEGSHEKVIIQMKDDGQESELVSELISKNESIEYEYINAIVLSVTDEEKAFLEADESIELIEEDKEVTISSTSYTWGLERININTARQSNLNGTGVKIAIIDTGVMTSHPYLEIKGGKSFVSYTNSFLDDHGHGTHIAGTVGALYNPSNKHAGVAPSADVYALKALNQDGRGNISDIIAAIDWAIKNQMDVINLSFGTPEDISVLKEILDKAYDKGILIVASSGNVGTNNAMEDNVQYPAKYSSVISVSAINSNNKRASFSSTGPAVEVTAPGESIYSTAKNNGYEYMDGTSMASGFVTGNLALLKEAYPNQDHQSIRRLLHTQSVDLGTTGRDYQFGHGLIQAPLLVENYDYFKVVDDRTPVFDNSSGSLVKVAELEMGQVYPRTRDYGNWHEIDFGRGKGYVRKSSTIPANKDLLKNLNSGRYKVESRSFVPNQNVLVYDNSTGTLVPFARLMQGKSYPIISDFGNWWRVDVAGRIGYVSKSAVQLNFTREMKYFKVTSHGVPVYDNSTGRLIKVGELVQGETYPRLRDYGNWHEIKFGNGKGYVSKAATQPANSTTLRNENTKSLASSSKTFKPLQDAIVYDNSTGALVPFAILLKGKEYPIISDYGSWWRVDVSGRIGYVRKSTVQLSFNVKTSYFEVIEDRAAVYDNSSGNLVKVGELREGQVYPRSRDYGNWHEINFGKGKAYINKAHTKVASGALIRNLNEGKYSISSQICTINRNIEVYDNSSGSLVSFASLESQLKYPTVSSYGSWWRIDVADRIGYIRKIDVSC
ncbi:S8 family peptidase [Alkalihalophilus marmarensis]|uniref:S8 family peptidase n=1 Tax=Alkalihalophilus marmarensis TaxID=521377 RepID=UPI002E2332AA|nr:S8 family peptidase [Alkalihalophilus marmarensis]